MRRAYAEPIELNEYGTIDEVEIMSKGAGKL
jgi:hypothetical protein